MSAWVWIEVALLGGVGAVTRFVLAELIDRATRRPFPYGILAVNLSGAFLLGLLDGLSLTGDALTLAGTATLGAYTTFSTWMLDSRLMAGRGDHGAAALNVVVALLAGFAVALLGRALGRAM